MSPLAFSSLFAPRPSLALPRPAVRPASPHRLHTLRVSAQTPLNEIDFSRLNISEAGKELAGMVFVPDASSEPDTRCAVNYYPSCEAAINTQINVEYTAAYAYHALFAYFDRDTVALPGFAKFFNEMSHEEREHAHEFMKYQNKRGGRVVLKPVAVPEMKFEKLDGGVSDALYAMDLHLQLEKFVFRKLLEAHKTASEAGDPQMTEFLEQYLSEQVKSCKKAADYVAQLKRIGTGHGVWDFDKTLQ